MRIGASLILIAIGAILRFAINKTFTDVNLQVIGVILMIVGAVALILTIILMSMRRRTDVYQHGPGGTQGTTYMTPRPGDPNDPRY